MVGVVLQAAAAPIVGGGGGSNDDLDEIERSLIDIDHEIASLEASLHRSRKLKQFLEDRRDRILRGSGHSQQSYQHQPQQSSYHPQNQPGTAVLNSNDIDCNGRATESSFAADSRRFSGRSATAPAQASAEPTMAKTPSTRAVMMTSESDASTGSMQHAEDVAPPPGEEDTPPVTNKTIRFDPAYAKEPLEDKTPASPKRSFLSRSGSGTSPASPAGSPKGRRIFGGSRTNNNDRTKSLSPRRNRVVTGAAASPRSAAPSPRTVKHFQASVTSVADQGGPESDLNAYKERIAELQRQIAQAEVLKNKLKETVAAGHAEEMEHHEASTSSHQGVDDLSGSRPSITSKVKAKKMALSSLPTSMPLEQASPAKPSTTPSKNIETATPPATSHPSPAAVPAPVVSPYAQQGKRYDWEKPVWATQTSAIPDDQDILTDSIGNNLRSPNHNGYERKVFPNANLSIDEGKFVPKSDRPPPPRLAWIIVAIGDKRVGKIVIHLHGKHVDDLVDQFLELRGMTMSVCNVDAGRRAMSVDALTPELYVVTGSEQGLYKKDNVYGAIQEGHNVFDKALQAKNEGEVITIKQAHIYPVKKGKSG